jgi:hypothetical protein
MGTVKSHTEAIFKTILIAKTSFHLGKGHHLYGVKCVFSPPLANSLINAGNPDHRPRSNPIKQAIFTPLAVLLLDCIQ